MSSLEDQPSVSQNVSLETGTSEQQGYLGLAPGQGYIAKSVDEEELANTPAFKATLDEGAEEIQTSKILRFDEM